MKLYSNEIVFRGHPDKVCDQISDALLDAYLAGDNKSRCGIEVMGGKGKIFITGEVTSKSQVDVSSITKRVLRDIGYSDNYEIINNIGVDVTNEYTKGAEETLKLAKLFNVKKALLKAISGEGDFTIIN